MTISVLRYIAATGLTLSGISHIAGLWLYEINLPLLVSVLFGAIYLFIGIGLFGQSRFALVTAIAFPALGAGLALSTLPLNSFSTLGFAQLEVDFIVVLFSAIVLFRVRNNPSV